MGSIASFVSTIAADLDRKSASDSHPVARRKLSTVLSKCGYGRRHKNWLEELHRELADAQVFFDPDVTDMDLGLDTWIRFTREPPRSLNRIFSDEKALGYHLSRWSDALEKTLGLGSLRHVHGGRKAERQYPLDDAYVKPDLVFRSEYGPYIVCELEVGDPKDESVSQLLKYVDAADAAYRSPVVGVLITAKPRRRASERSIAKHLSELSNEGRDLRWFWYDVHVDLAPPN